MMTKSTPEDTINLMRVSYVTLCPVSAGGPAGSVLFLVPASGKPRGQGPTLLLLLPSFLYNSVFKQLALTAPADLFSMGGHVLACSGQ